MTAPATTPVRYRLAVGLSARNEAEFVALVGLAGPLLARGAPVTVVVPALDHGATTRHVTALVGSGTSLTVEPAHEYLERGHDRVALVGDDPVARGQSLPEALRWLQSILDGHAGDTRVGPDPGHVVAWLGGSSFPRPVADGGEVPTSAYAVVPLENGRSLIRTAWGAKLLAFSADRSLTPDLALDGVYDPAFVRFLERNVGAGSAAVDVGANVGVFAVRLAQLVGPSGSVLALEADPDIHAVLQENLDLNYVSGWARAVAVAAYSSTTDLTFHRTSRFRGNGSLREKGAVYQAGCRTDVCSTIVVEAVRLDDLLSDADHVSLVKVDVEGAERHVLEGLSGTIADGRVDTVAIEFVRAGFGEEWEPLCALLAGYRKRNGATFSTVAPDGSRIHRELEDAVGIGAFPQLLIDFGDGQRA